MRANMEARPDPAAPERVGQHRRSVIGRGSMGSSAHVAGGGARRAHPVRSMAVAHSAHPGAAGRAPPGEEARTAGRDRAANNRLLCHAEVTAVSYSPHRHYAVP